MKKKSEKKKEEKKVKKPTEKAPKITNQYLTDIVGEVNLPNGVYKGNRDRYEVTIFDGKKSIVFESESTTPPPISECVVVVFKKKGKVHSKFE